jgi:hypothetical protein
VNLGQSDSQMTVRLYSHSTILAFSHLIIPLNDRIEVVADNVCFLDIEDTDNDEQELHQAVCYQ